jgi:hypothetical protein
MYVYIYIYGFNLYTPSDDASSIDHRACCQMAVSLQGITLKREREVEKRAEDMD